MIEPFYPKAIVKLVLEDGTEISGRFVVESASMNTHVSDMGTVQRVYIMVAGLSLSDYQKLWPKPEDKLLSNQGNLSGTARRVTASGPDEFG